MTGFAKMNVADARRHRGFTLLELLIVIGIIGVLMAILLPAAEKVRHQAYIDKCASNLRQIGMAMQTYALENHGNYPRTIYNPATANTPVFGTGVTAADAFASANRPADNDITAGLFLLMRSQRIPGEVFICPYNDETTFVADIPNPAGQSNFTDYHKNLGYSFANPYPTMAAQTAGFNWSKPAAGFALGADSNPGVDIPRGSDVTAPVPGSPWSTMKKANSKNHERDGQNVLYGDGHVEFKTTPFAGLNGDNIFTNKSGQIEASPVDGTDSVLLPDGD